MTSEELVCQMEKTKGMVTREYLEELFRKDFNLAASLDFIVKRMSVVISGIKGKESAL